jgi:NADH:ubiquinone oxidoreductase subunit 5 (subunit L)/multisubunit Na+/H+ antiporter MnhA subunit
MSQRQTGLAAIGLTAALLHVWNHSAMKGLLFFAAGSVVHAAHAKDAERLGGLMKRLPWTSAAMLVGCVAVAGLPPLNGFASEWLMYLGLMKSGLTQMGAGGLTSLLSVSLLAIIGALAVVTFARLVGVALLGTPRSHQAEHAQEASLWMLLPMAILVVGCIGLGAAPGVICRAMANAVQQVGRFSSDSPDRIGYAINDAPLNTMASFNVGLWLVALTAIALVSRYARQHRSSGSTWGCGYVRPTARMQYTSRSFGEFLVRMLPRPLRPRQWLERPEGLFPAGSGYQAQCPDPVSRSVYEPLLARAARRCVQLRVLQQGQTHLYLAYIIVTVVVALLWASAWAWGRP